jgi:hypothetical protein
MVYCGDLHQWENFDFSDGNILKAVSPVSELGIMSTAIRKEWYPPTRKTASVYFERFKFP